MPLASTVRGLYSHTYVVMTLPTAQIVGQEGLDLSAHVAVVLNSTLESFTGAQELFFQVLGSEHDKAQARRTSSEPSPAAACSENSPPMYPTSSLLV